MKKYAVMTLTDLKIRQFDHKDDMQTAVNALNNAGKGFVVLIWQTENETYYIPEQF